MPGDWSSKTAAERHRPPHAVREGLALFITAATLRRVPHLKTAARRDDFVRLIHASAAAAGIHLLAWVVLKEHYHLIVVPEDPECFSPWTRTLHAVSATKWNEEDDTSGRQVWYQYWDRTLWTEGDLWSRINYVHMNPVRHGYVSEPDDWEWSSHRELMPEWEEHEAIEKLRRFPAPRQLPNDDF